MPTVLSLFAGIGGFDLGLERAGFTVVGQVELDPFCQRVLARQWPGVARADDVRSLWRSDLPGERGGARADDLERERIQRDGPLDLLVGGFPCQDLSVAGKRAGLGGERSGLFWQIVRIAKELKPTWGLFENVPGLISSNRGRDLWLVLQGLRECWPAVGWRVLDSRHFGVAQRRRRVFLVCGPSEDRVAAVLALAQGSEGDPQAGGEAGADVAGAARVGVDLARALGGIGGGQDYGANNAAGRRREDDVNLALSAEGHDASEDGTGRGTPLIAFDTTQVTSRLNRNNPKPGDPCHPLAAGAHAPAIAGSAVRRLTPVECERLQGFPDGWTCLCQPLEAYAEDADRAALRCTCPDSPRYRALGNAVTVNVIEALGRRLYKEMTR